MFGKKPKTKPEAAPGSPDPYMLAKREYLERNGDDIKRCAQWRTAAFFSFLLLGGSVAGNIAQGMQSKITPYVVNVDDAGRIRAVGRADEASAIPQRVVQSEIAGVITNWRTVTADIPLQSSMLKKLAAYLSGSASTAIREWYASHDPYVRAKEELVSVEIKGLPLPVSASSWRVEWVETRRNHQGATQGVESYVATLGVKIVPPKDESKIVQNPGGVMVTEISISKQLGQ